MDAATNSCNAIVDEMACSRSAQHRRRKRTRRGVLWHTRSLACEVAQLLHVWVEWDEDSIHFERP